VAINGQRGKVSDAVLSEARSAGISDAEVVEVVGHVALNVFTNYLNNVAQTDIDFPVVALDVAA
jgi:alkylhydroperoxidase family enzyme